MTEAELTRYAEMIAKGCVALRRGDVVVLRPSLAHRDLAVALAEVSYRAGAEAVEIEVRDTGRGIPPSEQDRIFDRFYQAGGNGRGDGFGLGLAIVREAVTALSGHVEVDSAPGRGTVVRVTLTAGAREP
jgi:signal transduction histidine kinase